MQYIKARYLKDGNTTGREYTFASDIPVGIGDKVSIGSATAIVTQVDVPEEEVSPFKDRLKKIDGKADEV